MHSAHKVIGLAGLTTCFLGFSTAFGFLNGQSAAAFEIPIPIFSVGEDALVRDIRELITQGRTYYRNSQYDLAIQAFREAYDKTQQLRRRHPSWQSFTFDSLTGLADSYLKVEDYDSAVDAFRQVIRRIDPYGEINLPDPSFQRWASIELELAMAYFQAGDLNQAERMFHFDITNYENAVTRPVINLFGASEAVVDRVLVQGGTAPGVTTAGVGYPALSYNYLQQIEIARGDFSGALEIAERSRSQVLYDRLAGTSSDENQPLSIAEIQELAADTEATLLFYSKVMPETLYVWVVQPEGAITFRQVNLSFSESTATNLEETVNVLLRSVQNEPAPGNTRGEPSSVDSSLDANLSDRGNPYESALRLPSAYNSKLQQGYQRFIAPIEDALPKELGSPVIVIPHQELFLVPFAALQDAEGRYLIEKYELSYTSSLRILRENRHRAESRPLARQRALIASNPNPMPGSLPSLPGADLEARAIAVVQPNASLFSGEYATEEMAKALVEESGVLHFATHGFYDDDDVLDAWIALAPTEEEDGFFTVREIFEFDLTADLVVLSACSTGEGQITGDGVLGLTRAFIRAGASTIVSSLWAVNDESTAFLMAEFHRQLRYDNATKAGALRAAMLATMQQYPQPRDWASFVLVGNPD